MCDDIFGWGFNTEEYKLTVKLAKELQEKYGKDFELLFFTALWVSEDPDDKDLIASTKGLKDEVMRFIREKKTEGLVRLCKNILVDVLKSFIPWLENVYGGKVKYVEIESYYASYKDMILRFYMESQGEERRVAFHPCETPDGLPYLLILCELEPLCVVVCTESYEFDIDGVEVSFIALV